MRPSLPIAVVALPIAVVALLVAGSSVALADDFVVRSIVRDASGVRISADVDPAPWLARIRAEAPGVLRQALQRAAGIDLTLAVHSVTLMPRADPRSIGVQIDGELSSQSVHIEGGAFGYIDVSIVSGSRAHVAIFLDSITAPPLRVNLRNPVSIGSWDVELRPSRGVAPIAVRALRVTEIAPSFVAVEAMLDTPADAGLP